MDLPRFRIGNTELVSYRVGVDHGVTLLTSDPDEGEDRATANRTRLHVSREFAITPFVSSRLGAVTTYTSYGRGGGRWGG
jgi:hypothetical protein